MSHETEACPRARSTDTKKTKKKAYKKKRGSVERVAETSTTEDEPFDYSASKKRSAKSRKAVKEATSEQGLSKVRKGKEKESSIPPVLPKKPKKLQEGNLVLDIGLNILTKAAGKVIHNSTVGKFVQHKASTSKSKNKKRVSSSSSSDTSKVEVSSSDSSSSEEGELASEEEETPFTMVMSKNKRRQERFSTGRKAPKSTLNH